MHFVLHVNFKKYEDCIRSSTPSTALTPIPKWTPAPALAFATSLHACYNSNACLTAHTFHTRPLSFSHVPRIHAAQHSTQMPAFQASWILPALAHPHECIPTQPFPAVAVAYTCTQLLRGTCICNTIVWHSLPPAGPGTVPGSARQEAAAFRA